MWQPPSGAGVARSDVPRAGLRVVVGSRAEWATDPSTAWGEVDALAGGRGTGRGGENRGPGQQASGSSGPRGAREETLLRVWSWRLRPGSVLVCVPGGAVAALGDASGSWPTDGGAPLPAAPAGPFVIAFPDRRLYGRGTRHAVMYVDEIRAVLHGR